jgi:hypothetical protein
MIVHSSLSVIGILPILALQVEVTVRRRGIMIRYLNRRFQVGGPQVQVSSSPGLLNLKVCMLPTRTLPAHHWQLLRVPLAVIMPRSVADALSPGRPGPPTRSPSPSGDSRGPLARGGNLAW